ncbi:MAG: PaaI family thioesterase [Treponema sp.]|jgi:acyl-CoA thioesterase|nr:PaaI family thioesterase [Treponema sp.]
MMNIDIERLRKYFASDQPAVLAGIAIESAEEETVCCSMEITPAHVNAAGIVQGGVIFTLADFTFAVHSNLRYVCGEDAGITVGQSCHVTFLRVSNGKRLTAKSVCLSRGRTMSVYRVTVEDDLGVSIADFVGNGFTTTRRSN